MSAEIIEPTLKEQQSYKQGEAGTRVHVETPGMINKGTCLTEMQNMWDNMQRKQERKQYLEKLGCRAQQWFLSRPMKMKEDATHFTLFQFFTGERRRVRKTEYSVRTFFCPYSVCSF